MPLGSKNFKTAEDFKDPNKFYRVFSGNPAYEDILESGKIRTVGSSSYLGAPLNNSQSLADKVIARPTSWPSFAKGKANLSYAQGLPDHYIIETDEKLTTPKRGRHSPGSTHFPTDKEGKFGPLNVDETKTKIYRHVGEGKYKQVRATNKGLGATAAGFAFAPMVGTMIDIAMQGSKSPDELKKELEENEDPMVKRLLEDYRKRMSFQK